MVLFVTAAAFADERYVKTLSGAVTYNGGRVTIEHVGADRHEFSSVFPRLGGSCGRAP